MRLFSVDILGGLELFATGGPRFCNKIFCGVRGKKKMWTGQGVKTTMDCLPPWKVASRIGADFLAPQSRPTNTIFVPKPVFGTCAATCMHWFKPQPWQAFAAAHADAALLPSTRATTLY
jgi:hypothetical protein